MGKNRVTQTNHERTAMRITIFGYYSCETRSIWLKRGLVVVFSVGLGLRCHAETNGLDLTFNPAVGSNGVVNAILPLPNGQVMVGGSFTNVLADRKKDSLVRLNADGSADGTFPARRSGIDGDTEWGSCSINALLRQPDGKILVAGSNTLFRLDEKCARDTNFPNLFMSDLGDRGISGTIHALTLQTNQPDSTEWKIVAAFSGSLLSPSRTHLARFKWNGNLDNSFKGEITSAGIDPAVLTIAVDRADHILVGGKPSVSNGSSLVRLEADGTLDGKFNGKIAEQPGFEQGASFVRAMAFRPDGYLLLGGSRTGNAFVALVSPEGELVGSFQPNQASFPIVGTAIRAILPLQDGRAVLGGDFASYGDAVERNGLVGILTAGTLDTNPIFDAKGGLRLESASGVGRALALDIKSGLMIVAGDFDTVGGVSRRGIARFVAPNQPPQAAMISPTTSEVFPTDFTIPFVAKATDDRGVSGVKFQVAMEGSTNKVNATGVPRGEGGSNEFTGQVPAGSLPSGRYTVMAIVTDTDNVTTNSAEVAFRVETNPATGSFTAHRAANTTNSGGIAVQILGPKTGGRWRLEWEPRWHESGDTNVGIEPGEYMVAFQPLANRASPTNLLVRVDAGTTQSYDYVYPPGHTDKGGLTVKIQRAVQKIDGPSDVAGALWVLDGLDVTNASNATLSDLPTGTHVVRFLDAAGWRAPDPRFVTIFPGQRALVSVRYQQAHCPQNGADSPNSLTVDDLDTATEFDPTYSVNGQLTSATGLGSGVAVREGVVLTAAHVVFFETNAFAYPEDVLWHPGRMRPDREPRPLLARGFCFFTGYADAKAKETNESILNSAPLDVAAVWFSESVARGGYAGYLVSQAYPSEWLNSSNRTTLIGYPVGGGGGPCIVNPGVMHATPRRSNSFQPLAGDAGLYITDDFVGFPGNSGSAVFAEYVIPDRSTNWFPAGVYLGEGTSDSSRVRVIDTNVLSLINAAASLAASGGNYSAGGAIRYVVGSPGLMNLQTLTVNFTQPAVAAKARWSLREFPGVEFTKAHGQSFRLLAPTNVLVTFPTSVEHFLPMGDVAVSMVAGQDTVLDVTFEAMCVLLVESNSLYATSRTTGNARLQFCSALPSSNWVDCEWAAYALEPGIVIGTNPVKVLDFLEATNHPGFYRVRIER